MIKLSFLTLWLFPFIVFSQTGKIVGTVTDARTGEPMTGANVIIEGTLLGTAADIGGNILILNVGPGTYSLRTTYVGYRDQVIENIRVSVNLTTEVNFQLQEEVLESDAIVVVAEKPLINKNVTNSPLEVFSQLFRSRQGLSIRGEIYIYGAAGSIRLPFI
jgi:hypothetical protein